MTGPEASEALRRDARNLPALIAVCETMFPIDPQHAIALLRAAEPLAPEAYLLQRVLSGFLQAQGDTEAAAAHAARAVSLNTHNADARLHLANILLAQRHFAAAVPHLLAHAALAPEHAPGWHLLSIALFYTSQPARAIDAIRRAIALHPASTDYRLHLASLLTARALYGDALTELALAAAAAPDDPRIPRAASGNHEALGDLAAAYQAAEQALALAPDDVELSQHHALLTARMGLLNRSTDPLAHCAAPRRRRAPPPRQNLRARLAERLRIIHALTLRDIRTRHSRSQLGYLWSVIEPISHLLTLGVIFALINQGPPPIGNSLFEFYCSGLLPYLLFAHIAGEVMGARDAGGALLLLPRVRTTDIVAAKTFLLLLTEIAVGIIVFSAFGLAGYRAFPAHLLPCAGAVLALALLAMGIGMINMILRNFVSAWDTIFNAVIRLLYFASGIYYSPIAMPDAVRSALSWNPILQGVEMFRTGFFADYAPFWLNTSYLCACAVISLTLGLGLEQVLRQKLRRLA